MEDNEDTSNNNTEMSICIFCKIGADEDRLGKLFISKECKFGVHQHCMFFSAGLPQNGDSHDGFEGFLENDILKEIQRAKRLRCAFCRKTGASVGCFSPSCRKTFHFSCGESKKCLFQYYGEFRAFCVEHRPYQSISSSSTLHLANSTTCTICLTEVHCRLSPDTLTTPCCKDTWFHRACVQKQALASGYYFRCAVCNNSEQFKNEMKEMGIYVPDRDAAWEGGGNFAELLEKYSRCDSSACQCPLGSDFSDDTGIWELVLCGSCGQYGIHVGCKQWKSYPPSLLCPTCRPVHESESPCRDKPLAALNSKTNLNSPGTCRSSRKTTAQPQRKRARKEYNDETDISDVLNGLKKRASDDFRGLDLNSDTKRIVHRALAAGTAATQCSKHIKPENSENLQCTQETSELKNFGDAAATDDDDDCVITKFIPACRVCPKCHRRKPSNKRLTVSESPKRHPATSSVGTGSSMTSPRTNGGPREKCTVDNNALSRPPFMEFLDSKPNLYTQLESGEKAFEIIERAARSIDKSSVLLIPHSKEDNKTPLTVSDVSTSCKTLDKKRWVSLQTVEDVVASVTFSAQDAPTSSATSFFATSVEKLVQFLNPHFSDTTREPLLKGTVASPQESNNLCNESELVKTSASPNLAIASSSAISERLPNCDSTSNNIGEFPFLMAALQKDLVLFAKPPSVPEKGMSASNGDVDSSASLVTQSKTCDVTLPRSDPDNTVIEEDRAYELRSGSESHDLVHRCVKSYC